MNKLKAARTILIWTLAVIAGAMMIFTIVSVSTFDQSDRSLFGYKAYVVLSDSMKKTDFDAGDLVLIKEVDPGSLQEGDIVAYISQNTANFGQTVTHKIRRLTTAANGEPGFITYGTTTGVDDELVVTYPYVLGKYEGRLPNVGRFFLFLKTTPGYLVCILLPFLVLILAESIRCICLFRNYRAQQQAQLQAQREQIEAQRLEAEQMLRQALAMKAQLEHNSPSDPTAV